jgi:hypothetical protein
MKRIVMLSALALSLLGGVASADRHRGGNHRGDRHNGRSHTSASVRWGGGVRVHSTPARVHSTPARVHTSRARWNAPRRVYVNRHHVVRRPIYVSRPVIDVHYYDYRRRPAIIAENYAPMAGYIWVAGAWSWSGYEWIWTAGHYEPDPNNVVYYEGYYSY